jgi:hypothetical protein
MSFKAESSLMKSVPKGRRYQVLEDDGPGKYDTVDRLIIYGIR